MPKQGVKIFLFFFLFKFNKCRGGRSVPLKVDENTSIVLCWDGNKLLLPIHKKKSDILIHACKTRLQRNSCQSKSQAKTLSHSQFKSISKSYSLDYEFESTAFSVVVDNNPEVWLPWFYPKYVPKYSHNNFSLQ